jgi:hypothetical protein
VGEEARRPGWRARGAAWIAGRWRGEAPLAVAFWDDMLIAGTALNAGTTLASMALVSSGAPNWLAAVVFFLPAPVNALLAVSVWRSASRSGPWVAAAARAIAFAWLLIATTV